MNCSSSVGGSGGSCSGGVLLPSNASCSCTVALVLAVVVVVAGVVVVAVMVVAFFYWPSRPHDADLDLQVSRQCVRGHGDGDSLQLGKKRG